MKYEEYVNILKRKINVNHNDLIFICIGTNDVLWDSLGPMVGNYLKKRIDKNKVIGDSNNNICSKWDLIKYYYRIKNKYIVSIDTAITRKEFEGEIFIKKGPVVMGLALNNNKGVIGNIGIKVAISDLKDISEKYIKDKARFIANGICEWNEKSIFGNVP